MFVTRSRRAKTPAKPISPRPAGLGGFRPHSSQTTRSTSSLPIGLPKTEVRPIIVSFAAVMAIAPSADETEYRPLLAVRINAPRRREGRCVRHDQTVAIVQIAAFCRELQSAAGVCANGRQTVAQPRQR